MMKILVIQLEFINKHFKNSPSIINVIYCIFFDLQSIFKVNVYKR